MINTFKKTVELYLLNEAPENQIVDELCRILRSNLKCGENDERFLQELSFCYDVSSTSSESPKSHSEALVTFASIRQWICSCITSKCLRHSVQTLITDNELLQKYYESNCSVHNENFRISLFICLSAFELNQSSLLSQIQNDVSSLKKVKHKRTSSHPNFSRVSVLPPTDKHHNHQVTVSKSWKSVPNVNSTPPPSTRSRSKTFSERLEMVSLIVLVEFQLFLDA